jgi:hypothetical protein
MSGLCARARVGLQHFSAPPASPKVLVLHFASRRARGERDAPYLWVAA